MAITYPTSLDALTNPTAADKTNSATVLHATQHANLNDIAEALEAKVGIGSSTPTRRTALVGSGTGSSVWDANARKNLLINGSFGVWQRGTSGPTTADNAYGPDRWRCLTETTTTGFVVSRESSDVPTGGSRYACKFAIGASNNIKGGIFSPLEGADIWHLRGQTVSLQLSMKVSDARIGDVRAAVVQWTGTEDSVSADPISAWGAAATVPTYTGSWANANTPANLSPTTSWATYQIEGISISSSATNLAVFIWIDDKTTTAGDYLLVTDVQLELGSVSTGVERRSYAAELALCQRYYEAIGGDSTTEPIASGMATSTSGGNVVIRCVPKRAAATFDRSAAADFAVVDAGGTLRACTVLSFNSASRNAAFAQFTVSATPLSAGQGAYLFANSTASARITIAAEL